MNDDNTTSSPAIELGSDDLACARGGLPVDPNGDPGGPTGRPSFLSPDAFRMPAHLPDPRIIFPPPYRAPSDKPLPGEQTPPILVVPVA